MYSLSVVLVGCRAETLSAVRRELATRMAPVEAECADAAALVQYERTAADRPERWESDWSSGGPAEKRRLYIIQITSAEELRELRWLNDNLSGHPVLALLVADERLPVIHALREGATQVVVLPLQAEDFQAALNRIAQQFGPAAANNQVIAVSGVTGGCGGTTIAINLAYELAHLHQRRCILAELTPQVGTFATYLNVEPQFTTRDVLQEIEQQGTYAVKKALTRVADHLEILAGPYEVIAPSEVKAPAVLQLIDCARRLADVVVLDVPCNFDALLFHTLQAANQLVLVAEQKVLSLRTLKLIRQALARAAERQPQHLVINRYDPRIKGFTLAELEQHLGVAPLMSVRNDWLNVSGALNNGLPLRKQAPKSPALSDLDALVETLEGKGQQGQKPTGLFGQLRRAIGMR